MRQVSSRSGTGSAAPDGTGQVSPSGVHPSGTQWTIESGDHRAVVVEVGGGLRAYQVAGRDVVDGYGVDEIAPGSAGQILAPWPNRIRDGRYAFDGHEYQLAITEPAAYNAIHGLVVWSAWQLVDRSPDAVTISHVLPAQPGYPWTLRLATRWSVGGDGLRAEHEVTNLAGTPAPFGLGAHPYLRIPGVPVEELELTVPAGSRLLSDGRSLPIGAARVHGGEYDFSTPRKIGQALLDTAFGELPGGPNVASISTVDGTAQVSVWADGAFHWWQVYSGDTLPVPRTRRSVAIEPMTCPPDAFHSGRDLVILAPGETWRGAWGIRATLAG